MVGKVVTLKRRRSACPPRRSPLISSATKPFASSPTASSVKTLRSNSVHHEHQVVWK